jgi:tRNA-intron endonuclease, archaea type
MGDSIVKAVVDENSVITENSDFAKDLFNKSRFGVILKNGQVQLSFFEALFLVENSRLEVFDKRKKLLSFDSLMKKALKNNKDFKTGYFVFSDLRKRGYIVKTALKFGADFRVYDRGVKPGEDHAKWVAFPVHESKSLTWYEFSAKARVAHSTKKKLLICVVDDEGDVSYWENKWIRP